MNKKFAIIVAIENYQNSSFSKVAFAIKDAESISETLKKLGYELEVLTNEKATYISVQSIIEHYLDLLKEDDEFLFYYVGHGFMLSGYNLITTWDSKNESLLKTCLNLQNIFTSMNSSICRRKIMFLDSCASGMQLDSNTRESISYISEKSLKQLTKDAEYSIVFSSCKGNERSYSSDKIGHGIWTYHVIKLLNGQYKDVLNNSKYLTISNFQSKLKLEVPASVAKFIDKEKTQNPVMYGNLSSESILVDFSMIDKNTKTNSKVEHSQNLKLLSFNNFTFSKIKSLSGFKHSNTVPKEVNSYTRNFVKQIGDSDVKEEFEAIYSKIKSNFKYKLREIKSSSPETGCYQLISPDFIFSIMVFQNPNSPEQYMALLQKVIK